MVICNHYGHKIDTSHSQLDPVKLNHTEMGSEAGEKEALSLSETRKVKQDTEDDESEMDEERKAVQIPVHRWVMHAAVMFGREFCYAMETALVTPVLLQIGLPEQYYSLTWFLSPILGLIFTPLIGSGSDRCTLRWGRRRPFILALCFGVLIGVALFLNGSVIGLSIGDRPNKQPIGIVLTVLGVVVLDFCADASEGPIRAYLLDVADAEEQDKALNIHGLSAGLGGALGYMLGGLDWTDTPLGRAFKSQEQVLFLFAGIIFIISVTLHMFSIPEQPCTSSNQLKDTEGGESISQMCLKPAGNTAPFLDIITEEDAFGQGPSREDNESDTEKGEMDFLAVDRVRSKSDSVLAMPDATIELDPDLNIEPQVFLPDKCLHLEIHGDLEDAFKPSDYSPESSPPAAEPPFFAGGDVVRESTNTNYTEITDQNNGQACLSQTSPTSEDAHPKQQVNGVNAGLQTSNNPKLVKKHPHGKSVSPRMHPPTFYRQPSFTFSYYGQVGSQRYRLRHSKPWSHRPVTTSQSLNDLRDIQRHRRRRELQRSVSSLSSESSSSSEGSERGTTVRLLWLSMLKMPRQLWRLCVCHLLTWFSIIAEAVFYTDFMGQVIFNGDPKASANSTELQNYHKGVQMGCWGLVIYAATAAVCSAILQKSLDNFDLSIKVIYIIGTLAFSIGTAFMAIFPNVYVAMVMISGMGIISMSISYCPYALLGQYHEIKEYINHSPENTRRGFGIDCAILSCQVYISQILVASALGSVVEAVGTVRVIPVVASGGAFLGFLTACFLIIYPDDDPDGSESDQDSNGLSEEQDGERTSEQRLALLNLPGSVGLKKTHPDSQA